MSKQYQKHCKCQINVKLLYSCLTYSWSFPPVLNSHIGLLGYLWFCHFHWKADLWPLHGPENLNDVTSSKRKSLKSKKMMEDFFPLHLFFSSKFASSSSPISGPSLNVLFSLIKLEERTTPETDTSVYLSTLEAGEVTRHPSTTLRKTLLLSGIEGIEEDDSKDIGRMPEVSQQNRGS